MAAGTSSAQRLASRCILNSPIKNGRMCLALNAVAGGEQILHVVGAITLALVTHTLKK